jgi:apolipoprotein N-acyltransferase
MSVTQTEPPIWRLNTFAAALLGSLLLWAALRPFSLPFDWFHQYAYYPFPLGWLGWIAPVPWLLLVQADELPGPRPYRSLYFAGLVFWLLAIFWLIYPYPEFTWLGWLALCAYLAIYLPAFVALSRSAIFRFALPLWLAAPIVWTGLELARAHLLTGFLMGSIAHTQANWVTLIQVSDLVGEYGVDFLILLVAACITQILVVCRRDFRRGPSTPLRWRRILLAAAPAAIVLFTALFYGRIRLNGVETASARSIAGPRVALIQGNSLAEWKQDPDRERQIMDEYIKLSERAVAAANEKGDNRKVDLIVWPETMFRIPLLSFDSAFQPPSQMVSSPQALAAYAPRELSALAQHLGAPLLVGIDRAFGPAPQSGSSGESAMQQFNSAVLVNQNGNIVGTYDKMHRVMFGEYIPFADWIPFLYRITPLTGGIVAGEKPAALWLDKKYCVSPNICYETAIPHVIRRQVATLERNNEHPSVLVNLTNDAWYWGSSELDMHLACDVFRAVETRVPLVIAANGGISAAIDREGRVQARCKKQTAEILLADVEPGYVSSLYVEFGDWFAGTCLACCIALSIVEWRARRALRRSSVPPAA